MADTEPDKRQTEVRTVTCESASSSSNPIQEDATERKPVESPKAESAKMEPDALPDVEITEPAAGHNEGYRGKYDPFANEEGSECKYKTMVWW